MNWNNCFSHCRYGVPPEEVVSENSYKSDWNRLISSETFRKLENKTHVFPLHRESMVYNRLTYSLESASVGRLLGKLIGEKMSQLNDCEMSDEAKRFYTEQLKEVIANGCLVYSIGDPVFSSYGESALSTYFKERGGEKDFRSKFSDSEWQDLVSFEAKANTMHILTKSWKGSHEGFQLTYSTLGSVIKYPRSSGFSNQSERKGYGYFKMDEHAFLKIAHALNMRKVEADGEIAFKRHPFSYIVEAADRICSVSAAMEDALRLGIVDYASVYDVFRRIVEMNPEENLELIDAKCKELSNEQKAIGYLKNKAISYLVERCAEVFVENQELIIEGEFTSGLLEEIEETRKVIGEISGVFKQKICQHKHVIRTGEAGYRIMYEMVKDFVDAAMKDDKERSWRDKRTLHLIPEKFMFNEAKTAYEKVMCIVEYISELTDKYAFKLHGHMRGAEIPGVWF